MMERLAIWRGMVYEGNSTNMRAIHPVPVISHVACDFIQTVGSNEIVFREDNFDPVTRVRRGRLYVLERVHNQWDQVTINDDRTYNWGNIGPTESYSQWIPRIDSKILLGSTIQIGEGDFATKWRIVGMEKISIGHILLTLRTTSLLGIIPEIANEIVDINGNTVALEPVQNTLDALVDAIHRQQPRSIVDVAREAAKVILTAWIGQEAHGKDLAAVICKIPPDKEMAMWAARIVNRFHPRGKSSEMESQASKGVELRTLVDEDAETSAQLIGLLLRELGWAAP